MTDATTSNDAIARRAETLYREHEEDHMRRTNRVFGWLMIVQWVFGLVLAFVVSPTAWSGRIATVHVHVWAALLLGGALSGLPGVLAFRFSEWKGTKHVVACAQVLWSALLIHLTGGRIETHFHVFGSLAFLSFYRDWRVLIAPTVIVAADHLVRGIFWPDSVYGVDVVQAWRFLEHAGWVVFEDTILVLSCLNAVREMRTIATQRAELESLTASEREKSAALERALEELRSSQNALVRSEKLAAIGGLAASVGHELRNPLAAIRNAFTFVRRKVDVSAQPTVGQMLTVADREIEACGKIIGDLLDYARERPLALAPCPLHGLVDESIGVIQNPKEVKVRNQIPADLEPPIVDRDLFRQVLVNLLQNAVEATPDGGGAVVVAARGGNGVPFEITVTDAGVGMPDHVVSQAFEPLFTTKTKGTGLGLAIVANMVRRHGGTIRIESEEGRGTCFTLEVPSLETAAVA